MATEVNISRSEEWHRGEHAVRTYLRAVVQHRPGIRRRRAESPGILGDLDRLQANLDAEVEAGFVAHAAAWAEREGVTGHTLAEFGVAERVLEKAGITVLDTADFIRSSYPSAPFTVRELVWRTGISEPAIRRVLRKDVTSGDLVRAGTVEGPGRPAQLFRRPP